MRMKLYTTNATLKFIGFLYTIATIATISGMQILQAIIGKTNYLDPILSNRSTFVSALLMLLINDAAVIVVGILFYCVGGVILNYFLFTNRLVPRTIIFSGFLGYILLFSTSVAGLLGLKPPLALFLPCGLFEFAFPLWIIIKGFKTENAVL